MFGLDFLPNAFGDFREDVNMFVQRDWAKDDANTAWRRGQENMQIANQFTERMASTQHQRAVNDLKAAGLNPMLSVMHGGNAAAQGAMSNVASANQPRSGSSNATNAAQHAVTAALTEKLREEADVARATAGEIRERTPNYHFQRESIVQSIEESINRIRRIDVEIPSIKQGTATSAAQMRLFDQELVKAKEMVEQIRETTGLLRAEADLVGKHSDEAKQRIDANLPRLESILKDLERSIVEMSLPDHRNKQAAADSFIGQLKAYMQGLIPLQGIIGNVPGPRSPRETIHRRR